MPVIDGALPGGAQIPQGEPQVFLLRQVEERTGRRYIATWTQDKPHWWSAELRTTE